MLSYGTPSTPPLFRVSTVPASTTTVPVESVPIFAGLYVFSRSACSVPCACAATPQIATAASSAATRTGHFDPTLMEPPPRTVRDRWNFKRELALERCAQLQLGAPA